MSFDPVRFILRDETRSDRFIEVMADVSDRRDPCLWEEEHFFNALARALAKWVNESEFGEMRWFLSGDQLKVEDLLTQHLDEGEQTNPKRLPLRVYLRDEGIFHFKLEEIDVGSLAKYTHCESLLVGDVKKPFEVKVPRKN